MALILSKQLSNNIFAYNLDIREINNHWTIGHQTIIQIEELRRSYKQAKLALFNNCLREFPGFPKIILILFFPMLPFDPPENIRKPTVFYSKTIGTNWTSNKRTSDFYSEYKCIQNLSKYLRWSFLQIQLKFESR